MKKLDLDPLQLGGTVDPDSTIYAIGFKEQIILRQALISLRVFDEKLIKTIAKTNYHPADKHIQESYSREIQEIQKILDIL